MSAKTPKPVIFTIAAGPNTNWGIKVHVWPDQKSYMRARIKVGGDGSNSEAFCHQYNPAFATTTKDDLVAAIHFKRKNLKLGYVVHECYHALLAYARLIKLKEQRVSGEEWAAESIEHMVEGVVWFLKKNRIHVK